MGLKRSKQNTSVIDSTEYFSIEPGLNQQTEQK